MRESVWSGQFLRGALRRCTAIWPRLAIALTLLALSLPTPPALSQVQPGASLTVIRGLVAVSRPDGTAIFPAGSGLTLAIGDIVGTLERTRAIVTFFSGSEVELGSKTTMIIRPLDRDLLSEANVTVENVAGPMLIRVSPDSPASWSVRALSRDTVTVVRVLSGDTVAVVRSGEVGHAVDPTTNNVTVACVDGRWRCTADGVSFPTETSPVVGQLSRTKTGRGDLIDQRVPAGSSVWNILAAAGGLGQEEGISAPPRIKDGDDDPPQQQGPAIPTLIVPVAPTSTATATPTPTEVPLCFGHVPTVVYPVLPGDPSPGPGDDVILGTEGPDNINGAAGNDFICGLGGDDTIIGGSGVDVIDGGNGDDDINGGGDDDVLFGGNGNDSINGAGGTDTCTGGPGADTVVCEVVTDPLP